MENRRFVDQRREALDRFFEEHRARLARGGSLVEKRRRRGGRRIGPYFFVTVRDADGRQCAVYVGCDPELVAYARRRLDALQANHRRRRVIEAARTELRRGLAAARRELDRHLAGLGLRLQGCEVRGWSHRRAAMRTGPVPAAIDAAGRGASLSVRCD
jgi:hypothetical protein